MLTGFSVRAMATETRNPSFKEQETAIYAHMKRYGIDREDVLAIRRLYETSPPYSYPHVSIASEKVLNPGEHYRIEMDGYVLTMKVPDAESVPGQWIWPYTNTRSPDPGMEKLLKQSKGGLDVANLGWYACNSIFPPGLFGRCETMGISMYYRVLKPEERDNFSSPANMRATQDKFQRSRIPSQEEMVRASREKLIDNRMGNQIVLAAEPVVINGRIWIRGTMSSGYKLNYQYLTYLHPDRILYVNAGPPNYEYTADPDLSSYPGWVRKSFAQLEEMIASLRIAKIGDDGSSDPFVIERVEPAPRPVREKLPTSE